MCFILDLFVDCVLAEDVAWIVGGINSERPFKGVRLVDGVTSVGNTVGHVVVAISGIDTGGRCEGVVMLVGVANCGRDSRGRCDGREGIASVMQLMMGE